MHGTKVDARIGSVNEIMQWYLSLKEKPIKEIWSITPVQQPMPELRIHMPNAAPQIEMMVSVILVFTDTTKS